MSEYQGEERRKNVEPKDQFFLIKGIHTLLIVAVIIVTAILSYGTLRDQNDENTRRIHEMEGNRLTKDVYDSGQESIKNRLDRIERKVDAQDVRNFRQDSEAGIARKGKS